MATVDIKGLKWSLTVDCPTLCHLRATELSGVGESTMSRRKSFKKSLRESFRRLRSRRSDRRRKTTAHDDDARQTYVNHSCNTVNDITMACVHTALALVPVIARLLQ